MKRLKFTLFLPIFPLVVWSQKQPNFKVNSTYFKKDTLSIKAMGGIANGDFINTQVINSAIKKQHEKGGGVVLIPKGLWLTGPIELKSNVNLSLEKGALIEFTSDFNQYPLVVSSFEGVEAARCKSPISAENQTNIAITGEGVFNGNGLYWRPLKKDKLSEAEWKRHLQNFGGALTEDKKTWYPSKAAVEASKNKDIGKLIDGKKLNDFENIKDFLRPNLLRISNCTKVLIEGVTFENSPAWTTHFLLCNDVTVKGMKVKNAWWAANTDAIDLESCSNVLLEDCNFDTGDDGITLKSGRDEYGRKRGKPTQNVIVKNCTVYHSHGGFVVGSEMSGGVKNIYVNDCNFIGSDIGLRFKSVRGRGGMVENIFVNNINMKDIVGEAILFDMYYAAVDPIKINVEDSSKVIQEEKFPVTEATPQFQHFDFSNIICDGAAKALFVRGLPEMPVNDITLNNAFIKSRGGIYLQDAKGVQILGATILHTDRTPILQLKNVTDIAIDTIALKKMHHTSTTSLAEKLAATAMHMWPDSFSVKSGGKARWSYDQGVILRGIESLWHVTGDATYFQYIQHALDYYVKDDGSIYDYKSDEFNIDHLNNGKLLLSLYQITGKEKYKRAIELLHTQLLNHPRNSLGGFWHKKIYPNQMWLDGLYMGAAFYAQYSAVFHDTAAFDDITQQFVLAEKYTRDKNTGLLVHAWDESKQQQWADKTTGKSPHVWARAMGWYGMALVDALDYYPVNHNGKTALINILNRWATAIIKVQDAATGTWNDILDVPNDSRNYKEASATSMFARVLFKGVRKGYLPDPFLLNANKAFEGINKYFIQSVNNQTNLNGTVSVSGLGGSPYRDGSLEYYFKEQVVTNDPKGIGAALQCAVEAEIAKSTIRRKHPVVLLDAYYNNEIKKDIFNRDTRWHYAWEEMSNGGLSVLGQLFEHKGALLSTLTTAPSNTDLQKASVYIIIDPDHVKDNPAPNFMNLSQAEIIANWVKAGGILLLMANDSSNCDLDHFNILSKKFGMEFTNQSVNMVKGNAFETGSVLPLKGNGIFNEQHKLYLKEVSAINVQGPSKVIATNGDVNVIGCAQYGKGYVLAIGDPWLYNEYVDGRKLPIQFDNHAAAKALVSWSLKSK